MDVQINHISRFVATSRRSLDNFVRMCDIQTSSCGVLEIGSSHPKESDNRMFEEFGCRPFRRTLKFNGSIIFYVTPCFTIVTPPHPSPFNCDHITRLHYKIKTTAGRSTRNYLERCPPSRAHAPFPVRRLLCFHLLLLTTGLNTAVYLAG